MFHRRPVLVMAAGAAFSAPALTGGCSDVSVSALPVLEVQLSPSELTLLQREESGISVRLLGPGGEELSGRTVTWDSDEPEVASVTGQGRVRGEAPGTTHVRASVDDASASVAVTVVEGPTIGLSGEEVELRAQAGQSTPAEETLAVENTGNGTLSGLTVSVSVEDGEGPQWLTATLSGNTAPATLRVRGRADGLGPGVYGGQVTISAEGAMNTPQAVDVTLQVDEPPPVVGLTPASVGLTAVAGSHEEATQLVLVANLGGGTLSSLEAAVEYPGEGADGWLTAELEGPVAPTSLQLRASARFLAPGTHRAQVQISSPVPGARDGVVDVVFEVSAPPGSAGGQEAIH